MKLKKNTAAYQTRCKQFCYSKTESKQKTVPLFLTDPIKILVTKLCRDEGTGFFTPYYWHFWMVGEFVYHLSVDCLRTLAIV